MSNVIVLPRHPKPDWLDVSPLATSPMPDVYRAVMESASSPSGRRFAIKTMRFVARMLVGSAAGAESNPPAVLGHTVNSALRRACDLLDLADELEKD